MTPAEIASMLHRKEERRKEFALEVERRVKDLKNKKQKKLKKIMNHLLHPTLNLKDLKPKKSVQESEKNPENLKSEGFLLPPRKRVIGHPSAMSEANFPMNSSPIHQTGRRNNYRPLSTSGSASNPRYKAFHDYASFSSFSDSSSCIVRRPSCDTISTYLSSQYR